MILGAKSGNKHMLALLLQDHDADLEAKNDVSLAARPLRTGPCSGLARGLQSATAIRPPQSAVMSEVEWEAALTGSAMGRRSVHGRCHRSSARPR